MISIIVAVNKRRGIGKAGALLYHLPEDMKRFKTLTTGHTVIMGRRTFESLPKGALPRRRNIVLSRQDLQFPGAECMHSLLEALEACKGEEEVFIIGGATLYAEAMPLADRLCVTEVDDDMAEADTFFPVIDRNEWEEESRDDRQADARHSHAYSFIDFIRRQR